MMDDDIIPALSPSKYLKTYTKADRLAAKQTENAKTSTTLKQEPLSTRNAVKFLIEGTLNRKVCRYCLNVESELSELDQIMNIGSKGTLYEVTIKDMVASFHPFKVADDPNFPNKICNKCLDRTLSSYLFTQQCEQAERALRNCFDDLYEKSEKLDPLERIKKRGRQKLHPNHNTLHTEHEKVIEYADPIIHIVNYNSTSLSEQAPISDLECLKCCEVLPNLESLLDHTKIHPKSMWFNCRLCGHSYPKLNQLKRHNRKEHSKAPEIAEEIKQYDCKTCGIVIDNYYEFLQHIEKHKFKMVMEHLIVRKMDKLCSVCLDNGKKMVGMNKMICLHGGCPELTGDRSLKEILACTLPEINILDNYTGTKICEKCLSHTITAYIFTTQTYFVRKRLNACVSFMLENLNKITETDKNICIEIAQSVIMNVDKPFDETLLDEDHEDDEDDLKVEVLEDEFRLKSEDESEMEEKSSLKECITKAPLDSTKISKAPKSFVNGYKLDSIVTKELSLKRKWKPSLHKFTCPICNKHFISDYFLKRHVLKHRPKKVECTLCNLEFKSKFDFYEHRKITHILNSSIYYACKVCGRCYVNEEKLEKHVIRHKNQKCQLCNKVFDGQSVYNTHMQRHVTKLGIFMKKYMQNCSFCEKDCPNDNEFSLHVNKVHLQIKPYGCDMCERQFYTEYNLRSHKTLHSRLSKEQCEFCKKILNSRKRLVIHIRKHIGETPFFCQICNQSFYSNSKLKKHMKVLHGGGFCCKICKSTFVTNKELKAHVNKTHNSSL